MSKATKTTSKTMENTPSKKTNLSVIEEHEAFMDKYFNIDKIIDKTQSNDEQFDILKPIFGKLCDITHTCVMYRAKYIDRLAELKLEHVRTETAKANDGDNDVGADNPDIDGDLEKGVSDETNKVSKSVKLSKTYDNEPSDANDNDDDDNDNGDNEDDNNDDNDYEEEDDGILSKNTVTTQSKVKTQVKAKPVAKAKVIAKDVQEPAVSAEPEVKTKAKTVAKAKVIAKDEQEPAVSAEPEVKTKAKTVAKAKKP